MEDFDMPEQNISEETAGRAGAVEFRFVSGPNNGAMLRLEQGEYFIGNTADSEVVFALDRQESIEFVIGIGEDRDVYARSRSGTVYLYNSDGTVMGELSQENSPLPEGVRIGLDFESLVWSSDWNAAGFRWRTVSEDELAGAGSAPEEAPAPEDSGSSGEQAESASEQAVAPSDDSGNSGITGEVAAGTDSGEKGETVSRKSGVSRRKQIIAVSVGLLLLAGIFALQNYGLIRDFLGAEAETGKPLTFREYIDGYPDGVLELEEKMNSYVVRGAFRDETQRMLFLKNLPAADKQVELNVRLVDDILNSVRRSFDFYGLRVNPVPAEGRSISLFGYVRDKYAEAEVMKSIKKDLPFVYSYLVPGFRYRTDLEDRLNALSRDADLAIEYLYGRGFIAYRGQFSMEELSKISFIRDEISKAVGGPVRLVSVQDLGPDELESLNNSETASKGKQVPEAIAHSGGEPKVPEKRGSGGNMRNGAGSAASEKLPGFLQGEFSARDVAAVNVSGPVSFFTAKNGSLYFEGSRLPDGSVITRIESGMIVMKRNGREIKVSLK